ncbi:uncharacterized protein LOC123682234 isoform X2 [Harmonia axyridis]|uniref:uncharacterized protein LOC123682234 isoform X2 n=1 Tax=Harmonia axyridis TaxID=115357 RepID=UPI001E278C3E|nr:uncharacterized protein LOC123682234 isoform X2 [Harmonia axyridis]
MKGNQILFTDNLGYNIRTKRDLTSINYNTVIKGNRRVRKKLIKRKPISENTISSNNNNDFNLENTTKHKRRRKLKIKKKKVKHIILPTTTLDVELSKNPIRQSRRKFVITRKRLLKASPSTYNLNAASITKLEDKYEQEKLPTTISLEPSANVSELNTEANSNEFASSEPEDTSVYDDEGEETTGSTEEEENSSLDEESDIDYDTSTTADVDESSIENDVEDDYEEDSTEEYDDSEVDENEGKEAEDEEQENSGGEEAEDEEQSKSEEEEVEDEEHGKSEGEEAEDEERGKSEVEEAEDDEEQVKSEENHTENQIQHVPDYEPFFPELSETFEAPIFLLKTTILSSIELQTKTIVQSRLRTYKSLITKVSGSEQTVISTTEVKPHIKTTTVVESLTRLTTLTLLDIDSTSPTISPNTESYQQLNHTEATRINGERKHMEEGRNYLATRVMSNGVEVIVAGDKSTIPGEPDVKRVLPSTIFKAVTLRPSTLSEYMMMLMPSDASKLKSITSSLVPNNKFVTKTCLTTFTYLTTYLESGTTTISSHEQVVSNIATEERNTAKIHPTPSMGITLTQYPSMSVGVFHTTYTYLNTLVDGDQPLIITSKHTVTNTVTAPDDYLSLIQPSEEVVPQRDTNTYYSTIMLTKTIKDGKKTKLVSKEEKLTQIVITESKPPKAASIMTSYVALDVEDPKNGLNASTTDIVKTYYVTYTYYNTLVEDGKTVVYTNISTSKDVSTQKIYLQENNEVTPDNVVIIATKTYHTTFTYFTTLLQENNPATPTVVSSHSTVVENVATETIHPKQLNENYWKMLKNELKNVQDEIKETVLLNDGQRLEVTAYKKPIEPTKVLPIQMTKQPQLPTSEKPEAESSNPNVITGSTIVFFDDDPFLQAAATPNLNVQTASKNKATTSSEVIKKTQILSSSSKIKKSKTQNVKPSKSVSPSRPVKKAENSKKKQSTKLPKPEVVEAVSNNGDLLGLGSINIESLKALTPVINAMAGLIETNLKPKKKNNTQGGVTNPKTNKKNIPSYQDDNQNRSPIYIPVGDLEVSESQNIASYHHQNVVEGGKVNFKKPTHETPLISGGIPISPGEVITANSDVIVGKPGRILPRVPPIPVNEKHVTEIADLHPPPTTNFRANRVPIPVPHDEVSSSNVRPKDDYIGPPPPISGKPYGRGEKHKHIPLHHNEDRHHNRPHNHVSIPMYQNHHHQFNYGLKNNDNAEQPSLQIEIQKKYEDVSQDNVPFYTQPSPVLNHNKNFQASVIKEPMVLPEVIERSTGQPLLVNIQPSQVAFVNIPHNRTTALIYGGSTEPHRYGQYFDDPSPHSGSDNAVNENMNVIQYTSGYPLDSNQKQVKGVITVGTQTIKVEPENPNSRIENIHTSKPKDSYFNANNQDINVQVPPISFGMFQNDNEFNAHVINHGNDLKLQIPPVAYEVTKAHNKNDNYNLANNSYKYTMLQPVYQQTNQKKDQDNPKDIRNKHPNINGNTFNQNQPALYYMNHSITSNNRRPNRTKTKVQIKNHGSNPHTNYQGVTLADYMIPPTFKPKQSKPIPFRKHTSRPPIHRPQSQGQTFQQKYIPHGESIRRNNSVFNGYGSPNPNDLLAPDYDLISVDGEVIQESNSHPLRVKTTQTPLRNNYSTHQNNGFKQPQENEVHDFQAPVIEDPRPFIKNPVNQFSYFGNDFKVSSFNRSDIKNLLKDEIVRYEPKVEANNYKPITIDQTSYQNQQQSTRKPPTVANKRKVSTTKAPVRNNRPVVTSLPIDHERERTETPFSVVNTMKSTQTEKPFNGTPVQIRFDDKNSIKTTIIHGEEKFAINNYLDANKRDQVRPNVDQPSLEVLKPPPLAPTQNTLIKVTTTSKPKEVSKAPDTNILRIPVYTAAVPPPQPMEEMKPPPVTTVEREIIGMSPPPITTYKPLLKLKIPTVRPVIPSQVNNLKEPIRQVQRVTTTTARPTIKIRTRRPYLPRRTFKPTLGTTYRPVTEGIQHPVYDSSTETRSTFVSSSSTTQAPPRITTPSSTTSETRRPILDDSVDSREGYIMTGPYLRNISHHETSTFGHGNNHEVVGFESDKKETVVPVEDSRERIRIPVKTNEDRIRNDGERIRIPVKIHDDKIRVAETSEIKQIVPSRIEKTSLRILPTKFITHTQTLTVTITKTTVLKTPGLPPVTSTLLVTKTEKSTIVDTVTEFHTLVQPTSVVETITTTVQHGSLYPPDVYGKPYPSIQIQPTETIIGQIVTPTANEISNESLEDFIITDTDPPNTSNESQTSIEDNDTILVVLTDKKNGPLVKVPPTEEVQTRDEMLSTNKLNDVLIAGVLSANPPSIDTDVTDRCEPECKASRNELCQKTNGLMRCVCRPGFARMFPDRPCNPTYTYSMEIELDHQGKKKLIYNEYLDKANSSEYIKLAAATHEALDRMVMQSDLRDIYHGVHLKSFKPGKTGVVNNFSLQLSDNTDEKRLEEVFKKYLRSNNFSLGGTDLYASKTSQQSLKASDFDECQSPKFHDCSENSQCFNLKGTYTCSCKEGYSDLSENVIYPGRVCSAELVGCERCNYHGTCYSRGEDQIICECFQWYSGETCYINLKVLLIGLVCLGFILFVLLLICCIVTCCKKKPSPKMNTGLSFFPQRVPHPSDRSTLDRRAMIRDSSSEDSRSETNSLPYITKQKSKRPKNAMKKPPAPRRMDMNNKHSHISNEQKDRSLTVMIPRAKYHAAPPAPNMSSYTMFDASKSSVSKPQNNESKLLSYLDAGPSPHKAEPPKRKYSSQVSESFIDDEPISRKTSGALVSAGFEVSATVMNNMGTLGTTCGTEADRSENATLIQKISADLLSCAETRSQTNTLRIIEDEDLDPMSNWMDMEPRVTTISESRSYEETTIPPPMKSLKYDYDTKASLHSNSHSHHHDEVAERDLGSTFLLPHTHLYKPERGSDISGFESL